ncbi:hydrogenase formation protein HypD [Desulfovibrio sp. OttesenSCG-928-F07]|nr:hydrogenase formation protein HypD [Desulfovibrio sp. OttesenSCG-928-F07]
MPEHDLFSALKNFSDPELCKGLLETLNTRMQEYGKPLRFMEVCGTHTVSIFRSGLRSLLPESIAHLSGPGCPVCVTHDREVAAYIELAEKDNAVIATFGDLMRVPGPNGKNLKEAQARGAQIEVVYSAHDALSLAEKMPNKNVVFLGVGFETTAPTVAATVQMAKAKGVKNFSVLSFHKLVPPALKVLLDGEDSGIDAFLLPGHVSTILGIHPYEFVATKYNVPSVIGGFDPADILQSLLLMIDMRMAGKAAIVNQYSRAVADAGNPKARRIMEEVFEVADSHWRGIGLVPQSGLVMRKEYEAFDAWKVFDLTLPDVPLLKGCKCGSVLKGQITPPQCPLFGKACTPAKPVGPCMVSTEGSCAAYFKYSM